MLGIMLVKASGWPVELVFCEVIIFSICMSFYLLADYDSPFNGMFRVTTAIIPEVVERTGSLYEQCLNKLRVEEMREEMSLCLQDKQSTNPKQRQMRATIESFV